MSHQLKSTPSSMPAYMWAILAVVMVGVGIIATVIFMNPGNKKTDNTGNTPTSYGGNQPGASGSDCSNGGPCTGLSNGAPGCTSGGPCTQDSSGQSIILGKVVAVSATSVTITPTIRGGNQTFGITANTRQNKGGGSGDTAFNPGDAKVGSDVGIVPSSSDQSQVQLVMLNLQSKIESGSGNTGVH